MILGAKVAAVVLIGLTVLETAPSCGQATADRTSGSGMQADSTKDATHVTVYRNADDVPNVATFCLGKYGWAATLSGTDAGENKAGTLVRFESLDKECT